MSNRRSVGPGSRRTCGVGGVCCEEMMDWNKNEIIILHKLI
jgi:hypothetical protein